MRRHSNFLRDREQTYRVPTIRYRVLRSITAWLVSLAIVLFLSMAGLGILYTMFFAPVNVFDQTEIIVEVQSGWSVLTIGNALLDAGLIHNKGVFRYYVDFTDRAGKLKSGVFMLKKSMNMDEIIDALSEGNFKGTLVVEGKTSEQIAAQLLSQGIIEDKTKFLNLCKKSDKFLEYAILSEATVDSNFASRKYALEGYLFPATYEFLKGMDEEVVIRKMLDKTESVLNNATYVERMNENAFLQSKDKVLILASLIQKEGNPIDYKKVSAVFHNRLKKGIKLESCASVQYVLGINRLNLTAQDIQAKSLYNTYQNKGLPIGPICNPSKAAIEAALNPDTVFGEEGYMYFCTKNPMSGELQFSKTANEHQTAVNTYRPLWEAYDKSRGN